MAKKERKKRKISTRLLPKGKATTGKNARKSGKSHHNDDNGHALVPSSPPCSPRDEALCTDKSGSVSMVTATTAKLTTVTTPVPVRAPYVICTFAVRAQ